MYINKHKILTLLLIFFTSSIYSKNSTKSIIKLNNDMVFSGEIKNINNCSCLFKNENGKYNIPLSDIKSINTNNKLEKKYYKSKLNLQENCGLGQVDADLYHGKAGSHIALGFFTGVFGILGVAIAANPTPQKGSSTIMLSKNQSVFSDPSYLSCYKKKAKGKLLGKTGIGLGAWVAFLVLLSSASY